MLTLPILYALGAGILVMFVSLIGVITLNHYVAHWIRHNLTYLVSFSAGLLTVVVLGLLLEAWELLPTLRLIAAVVVGVLLIHLLSLFVPELHHHHMDDECKDACEETPRPHANRILVADALHNITDGIILIAAFSTSITLGLWLTLAVVAHEAVQELSEYFVLRKAGLSARTALLRNFLASSTILLGVGIGAFTFGTTIEPFIIGVSAGALLYVVVKDLLPSSVSHAKKHGIGRHLLFALLGVSIMFLVSLLTPHEHSHQDSDTDQHEESEHIHEHDHEHE